MDSDVVGESLGELEAVFLAAIEEVLVKGEVVLIELLDLARLDVADDHVDVFDASFNQILNGIIN